MLLDEPLSNLDAALKDSLRWEIRDALKAAGVPAIWVTHDQDEALSIGDRVGVLNKGELAQIDSPENCFSKPASRFVAQFLGDASFVPGTLRDSAVSTCIVHLRVSLSIMPAVRSIYCCGRMMFELPAPAWLTVPLTGCALKAAPAYALLLWTMRRVRR